MDWKPERAVKAKVRDFQRKIKQKKAWLLKHTNGRTLCVGLQMATSSRLLVKQWVFSPGGIGCYLVPGFTPSTTQIVHKSIISKEVCRVFVLRCQSASHFTYPVSFHRVHLWHTVYTIIQVTFILSYTHTLIHSCVHNIYTTSIHTWLHQSPRVLFGCILSVQSSINHFKWQVPTNEHLEPSQKYHPQYV